jgi:hypothetical protein
VSRATDTTEDTEDTDARSRIGRRGTRPKVLVLTLLTIGLAVYLGLQVRADAKRSPEAFCRQLPVVRDLDRAFGNLDPVGVRQVLPGLDELRSVSPTEIEPRVAVLADTSRSLLSALDTAPDDGGEALEEAWRARQADTPAIAAAGRSVQDYARATCGIDLTDPTG